MYRDSIFLFLILGNSHYPDKVIKVKPDYGASITMQDIVHDYTKVDIFK